MTILITGGAGFIGSHLADLLISQGHRVVVLDNLDEQVHPGRCWPSYQPERHGLTRLRGDVRDVDAVKHALKGVDAVIHLAAKVGVGQGQYQIADYYDVNVTGTASLLEAIQQTPSVKRLFVAGSMSSYGEGAYRHRHFETPCDPTRINPRKKQDLAAGCWDPVTVGQSWYLDPIGIREDDALQGEGFYAMTKAEQERMALAYGRTYGIPVWVGRFFNCYGTRQALSNPYTGVVAIFANQILAGERPTIYEDGKQTRDFINVQDLSAAVALLIQSNPETQGVYNIGTGERTSILEMATSIAQMLGSDLTPQITGRYRVGDVRHCSADIRKLAKLGWKPKIKLKDGLEVLFDWLARQQAQAGLQQQAHRALEIHGLLG